MRSPLLWAAYYSFFVSGGHGRPKWSVAIWNVAGNAMIKIEQSDANNTEPLFKFSVGNNTRKYMDIIRDTEINRMIRDSL